MIVVGFRFVSPHIIDWNSSKESKESKFYYPIWWFFQDQYEFQQRKQVQVYIQLCHHPLILC